MTIETNVECFMVEHELRSIGIGDVQYRFFWNPDTDEEWSPRDDNPLPPGAMYYATWLEELDWYWKGPDGRVIQVVLPDGHIWTIDGRSNNCTRVNMPKDDGHRCWIRHGTPPRLTVDKNGITCAAGAGSIASPLGYHGFLRDGYFT